MSAAGTQTPDLSTLDTDALKDLVLSLHSQLQSRNTEIDNLKLLILKLKRMQFGRKSEKLDRQIEQLELQLEDLEATQAAAAPAEPESTPQAEKKTKPARRPLPENLPRETKRREPKQKACPKFGGALATAGEDVTEVLEYVPASFKVIREVRPKMSCGCCSRIVQEPASSRAIDRGVAGPGLAGERAGFQVFQATCRSTGRPTQPVGRGLEPLHAGRLGWWREPHAGATGGSDSEVCSGCGETARR